MASYGHQNTVNQRRFVSKLLGIGSFLCICSIAPHAHGSEISAGFASIAPDQKRTVINSTHLDENPVGIDLVLDTLIKYLILLLDSPTDPELVTMRSPHMLNQRAGKLIVEYQAFGIAPDLTPTEIDNGMMDSHQVLDILDNHSGEISLNMVIQNDLKLIVESLNEELEHVQ